MSAPATLPRRSETAWSADLHGPRPAVARVIDETEQARQTNAGYWVMLLVIAALILRPSELFPVIADLPLYELFLITGFGISLPVMRKLYTWKRIKRDPIFVCFLGVYVATVSSHLANFYLFGMFEAFVDFGKIVVFYMTLMATIRTKLQFRGLLFAYTLIGTTMVSFCVIDYLGLHDFPAIVHLIDAGDVANATGEVEKVTRMRGLGLFHDPNDLSMVIVSCFVLGTYFLTDPRLGISRLLWVLPLALLFLALILTKSRGGLLAFGIAGMALVTARMGRKYAIAAALAGVAVIPFLAGRQANMDLDESSTAFERVLMWREGFHEITSPKVFFGIGFKMYAELAGLVAHNSYIHAYVEMGLFGGTLFFGVWYFFFLAVNRISKQKIAIQDRDLARVHPFIVALVAGWCGSMFSLSRNYVVPTYLVAGMGAIHLNLITSKLPAGRLITRWDRRHLHRLVGASACTFLGLYLFVRFIA